MAKELHVDPSAMEKVAREFRRMSADWLDAPMARLHPVTVLIGDFDDGNALKKTIEAGFTDFETALAVLSQVFIKFDNRLISAAKLLTDADLSNDNWVVGDFNSVIGH